MNELRLALATAHVSVLNTAWMDEQFRCQGICCDTTTAPCTTAQFENTRATPNSCPVLSGAFATSLQQTPFMADTKLFLEGARGCLRKQYYPKYTPFGRPFSSFSNGLGGKLAVGKPSCLLPLPKPDVTSPCNCTGLRCNM